MTDQEGIHIDRQLRTRLEDGQHRNNNRRQGEKKGEMVSREVEKGSCHSGRHVPWQMNHDNFLNKAV